MQSIEKTGATVADAVAAGVAELGVDSSQVMVEVLDEGDAGIRGEGARPARVRLLVLGGPARPPKPPAETKETAVEEEPRAERPRNRERRGDRPRRNRDRNERRSRSYQQEDDDTFTEPAEDEIPAEEADEVARVGQQVVNELLQRMGLTEAVVGIRRAEPTRESEELHWVMNISGRGISGLVGNRGETLASLQYIARLIVSRQLQSRANIIVDAAQYKARRSERLRDLARRMADRAVQDGQTITLEPMPPNERRIIHLALRERPDVETASIGEGKSRKVTISPIL